MGALRRSVLYVVLCLLFASGFVGTTFAYFDGETDNGATVSGGYIARATSQTATASGYDGVVTWALPDTTGVQAQQILLQDNGTSTDCTTATFPTTVASGLPITQTTYTDSNRTASSGNGDQFCYRVRTYRNVGLWDQVADAPAAQLGLAVTSLVITNGGTSGKVDSGDTIVLTFNQKPATPTTGAICTFHTGGIVFIGDSTCSSSSDTFKIAKLSGYTVGGVGHQARSATVSVSASAPWTITVTVGANGQTFSGSGSLTLSSSLVSAATTDQATVCTSCLPAVSGSF